MKSKTTKNVRKSNQTEVIVASRPRSIRTEHQEQSILIDWILVSEYMQTDEIKRKILHWIHAIPNGYYKSPASRAKAKREGVKSGICDLFVPAPEVVKGMKGKGIRGKSGSYHGLYIEMKRKGESLRKTQKEFMDFLDLVHYRNVLCYTWRAAAREIVRHLNLKNFEPIPDEPEVESGGGDHKQVALIKKKASKIKAEIKANEAEKRKGRNSAKDKKVRRRKKAR